MSATIHPDLLALLEAVKDDPEEDAPRLVLADWLDEHGRDDAERDRADFIRLQCQLARQSLDDPTRPERKAREQSLRRTHLMPWLGAWREWVTRPDNEEWWFQRGLLRPWLKGMRWLDEGPQDLPAWGWVDGLEVATSRPEDV